MFDPKDPRANLKSGVTTSQPALTLSFADLEVSKFYEQPPQLKEALFETWIARGQNFVLGYTHAKPQAKWSRKNQVDEYVVLAPEKETEMIVSWNGKEHRIPGESLVFIPAGDSSVTLPKGGRVIQMLTHLSTDWTRLAYNRASYVDGHHYVTKLTPWPEPKGGFKIRHYLIDVPSEEGRFGKIWRCSTFMINYLDIKKGPRDVTKMSPHCHLDFEQCSMALCGEFIHHVRWPWTPNMNHWKKDEQSHCATPSICIIPPPAVHTTQAIGSGDNQLVDIFCPPRMDFSLKPGWVLNAEDYPMPESTILEATKE